MSQSSSSHTHQHGEHCDHSHHHHSHSHHEEEDDPMQTDDPMPQDESEDEIAFGESEEDDSDYSASEEIEDDDSPTPEKAAKVQADQTELRKRIVAIQADTKLTGAEKSKRIQVNRQNVNSQEAMTQKWTAKQKTLPNRASLASNKLEQKRSNFDLVTLLDQEKTYHVCSPPFNTFRTRNIPYLDASIINGPQSSKHIVVESGILAVSVMTRFLTIILSVI
jgi:hypothetical protein